MKLTFGLALDFGNPRSSIAALLDEYMQYIELAERYGMDSISAGETYPTGPRFFHLPSPLLVLAALAARTKLRLGTGVTLMPGWHPLRLAHDAAVLDQITNGRLILGVGVANPPLWQRFGVERETAGKRMDELLLALKALWAGEDGFGGEVLTAEGPVYPRPVQPGGPPLIVGGATKRAAWRAAEIGDGWFASTGYGLEIIRRQIGRYREQLPGRKPPVAIVNRLTLVVPKEDALQAGAPHVGQVLQTYARREGLDVPGHGHLDGSEPDLVSRATGEYCLIGTPESVRRQVQAYSDAGATQIQLRVVPGDMPSELVRQTISLFAEEVAPGFS